jgi:hypothetical protein
LAISSSRESIGSGVKAGAGASKDGALAEAAGVAETGDSVRIGCSTCGSDAGAGVVGSGVVGSGEDAGSAKAGGSTPAGGGTGAGGLALKVSNNWRGGEGRRNGVVWGARGKPLDGFAPASPFGGWLRPNEGSRCGVGRGGNEVDGGAARLGGSGKTGGLGAGA